jgi:hypothetical protein
VTQQLDAFVAVAEAQQRATGKHRAEIQRLVPLAQALARKAGPDGITVGSIRLAAGIEKGQGRALSWLCGVPRAAGLVNTGRRRMCPQEATRNDQAIYVSPEFAR